MERRARRTRRRLPTAEFFNDPTLTSLIDQALFGNQQLRILAQDIAIANNEIIGGAGCVPSLCHFWGRRVAAINSAPITPLGADLSQIVAPNGQPFPNPLPDFLVAANISWQIDIWRQLRNARDAAGLRYLGTIDGRNYVVTRLVAEIAENYYQLMALDKQLETLDGTIALQEQSLEVAKAQKEGARGTELGVQRFLAEVRKNQSQKLIIRQEIIQTENRINFLCGRFPQPVERMSAAIPRSATARAQRGSALAAAAESTRHPPGRARAGRLPGSTSGSPGPISFRS